MIVVDVQKAWLEDAGKRWFPDAPDPSSAVACRLIKVCNSESNQIKRVIFRVIRCHNCSQRSKGGEKVTIDLDLPTEYHTWLGNVQSNCNHKSVDKTLRILLDYYIAIFKSDPSIEDKLLS